MKVLVIEFFIIEEVVIEEIGRGVIVEVYYVVVVMEIDK